MLSPKGHLIPGRSVRGRHEAGFTMMELMFAVAMFGAFAVVTILSFTTFNRFASNSRYATLALSVAQERIDEIQTSPCTINSTSTLGPVLSLSGTTVTPNSSNVYTTITESNLPLNNDGYNLTRTTKLSGSTAMALTGTLTGTITAGSEDTQVIDTRTTSFTPVTSNVRLVQVTVTVAYTYRGTHYSISLSTVRATDNF